MNSDYEIYRAPDEEIPAEDRARLDGFLAGKADETRGRELERFAREFQELLKKKGV